MVGPLFLFTARLLRAVKRLKSQRLRPKPPAPTQCLSPSIPLLYILTSFLNFRLLRSILMSDHHEMAKLVFAVTVSFFLFALCHARISSDPIQNDAIVDEPKTVFFTFPQPDTKTTTRTTVLLPSEKHRSELPTMVEFKPKKTDPKLPGSDAKESETDSVHLTMVSFRPINRHFPRHSFPVTFRRGHHFRRHHHHHHIHKLKPRFHGREVPYGDDMILYDEKYSSSNRPLPRGGVRQIPARWAKFGHEGPRFHHGHDGVEEREHMKKKKKRHHRSVEREEMEGQHDHEGGFMNKFRQFLMQF